MIGRVIPELEERREGQMFKVRSTKRRDHLPNSCFTLVELLLVTGILVLMTGVMLPRLSSGYRAMGVRTAVSEVVSAIDWMSEFAIRNRVEGRFVFEDGKDVFWIESIDGDNPLEGFSRMRRGPFEERRLLPEGMIIEAVEAVEETTSNPNRYLRFFPDGTRTAGVIKLSNREGRSRWISVGSTIGALEVSREPPEQ